MTQEEAMEPVFVLFWATMAVLGGFLAAYVTRNKDIRVSAAVLSSFVAVGLGLGVLLGNSWQVPAIVTALTIGLAWACLDHYQHVLARARFAWRHRDWVYVANHIGNYPFWSKFPLRETWSQRLARWGFPRQYQMEVEAILGEMRKNRAQRYLEFSTRYVHPFPWSKFMPGAIETSTRYEPMEE
jgi:hypothetical protein